MLASLPVALLWAASFAASSQEDKGPLCSIEVKQTPLGIHMVAVDGFRCFRCIIPASERFYAPEQPIRLKPKAFNKAPSRKALVAALQEGGVVELQDKAGSISSTGAWAADSWAMKGEFPSTDHLWPDSHSLSCNPKEFVAMNADYVGDFMKITSKLSHNSVVKMLTTDHSISPVVFEALLDNFWLAQEDDGKETNNDTWLQYLLMPVQVRR